MFLYIQVDVAVERKDTEKLIVELMNMDIPAYEPSANHVQLTDAGNLSTLQHTVLVTILLSNLMCYAYHCQFWPMSEPCVMSRFLVLPTDDGSDNIFLGVCLCRVGNLGR